MKRVAGLLFVSAATLTAIAIAYESALPWLVTALPCFAGSMLAWSVGRRRERETLAALRSFRPRRERR